MAATAATAATGHNERRRGYAYMVEYVLLVVVISVTCALVMGVIAKTAHSGLARPASVLAGRSAPAP